MAAYAFANPGAAACAFINTVPLVQLADGTLVEANISDQHQAAVLDLISGAKNRIQSTFGAPRAKPIVVFFDNPKTFWPLQLNEHGSSNFLGSRACVMVGPKGQNLDVVAHELMHAELFDRVGWWGRFKEIPVWFDEGLAMQVDFRPKYGLPSGASPETKKVRTLEYVYEFFTPDTDLLTWNYAAAKAEVAEWLADVGNDSVYNRLERIRLGESFDAATPQN